MWAQLYAMILVRPKLKCGNWPSSHLAFAFKKFHSILRQKFGNVPQVIGNASLHRRRNADTGMNSVEIVEGEAQRECCPVVLPLLAEAVRQPTQSANRPWVS
jgi:hypothetical protein